MKITKYEIYASYSDAMKLYRKAMKAGYSYGEIEQTTSEDKVQIGIRGRKTKTVVIENSRKVFSNEFNCEVIIPEKTKVVDLGPLQTFIQINGPKYKNHGTDIPMFLLYKNYSQKSIESPDFELVKLTLVREY